jgi:hypothetical protein
MQARQGPAGPQPPSSGDRISLLRLAEHVSRNIGPIPAALAIREKWFTGALQFWVQWIFKYPFGTSSEGFFSFGEEAVPPWFLHDLEERGMTAPRSLFSDERCGMSFQTIINASELGIYLDDRPAWLFRPLVEEVDGESAACIFTSRGAAAQFWPMLDDQPKPDDKQKATQGRRSTRGPPTAFDWEGANIAASAFAYEHGLPKTQGELVRFVDDWFGNDGPGETQIKAHIAPLYRALVRAAGR